MARHQRVALHSIVREGYRDEHARVPDELMEVFERVGIHEWTIWRSGDRMFHLVVCDDFDDAIARIAQEPANLSWQARIGPFVEHYRDSDGARGFAPLDQVWDLAGQRAGDS